MPLEMFQNPDRFLQGLERISKKEKKEKEQRFAEDALIGVFEYLREQNPPGDYRPILYSDSEFVTPAGPIGLEELSSFNIVIAHCGPGLFRRLFPKAIARFSYTNSEASPSSVKIKTYDQNLLPREKARELAPKTRDINYLLWEFRNSVA